ncbi:MAG: sulfite exporter TauE/SafE family protein [Synergistaceae bacterium]|jgi:sulfite exporter TauE/SafE/copper chaperone CopZ/plastocyanin|nr:sulfite exporter TauE/SafE family protein [Synergistaceae bacterium]
MTEKTDKNLRTEVFRIGGMTCAGCERTIERGLRRVKGVRSAEASYPRGTAEVVFDPKETGESQIRAAIEGLDYKVLANAAGERFDARQAAGVALLVLAVYMLLQRSGGGLLGSAFNFFPQAESGMGYGALFVVGLLTSVHCIAMCGGINISQCLGSCGQGECGRETPNSAGFSSVRPSLLYNAGRVASYTAIGGAVGALGSAVSFTGAARGIVQLIAGVFMVIIGINMLGIFSPLRRFAPRLPKFLADRVENGKNGRGPLYVGLLNGLMPCGPLQAMQLYALSTGSALQGAASMLAFSMGTAPLMFGLGAFSSIIGKKFTGRVMKAGAMVVIVMGVAMFSNGMALSDFSEASVPAFAGGLTTARGAAPGGAAPAIAVPGAVQEIVTDLKGYGYPSITVKVGSPVKWNLRAAQGTINGCNNALVIPAFGIEKRLSVGDNVIEFTPTKAGTYRYSCWMGMIRGRITVVDGGDLAPGAPTSQALPGASVAEAAETESYATGEPAPLGGCPCCAR